MTQSQPSIMHDNSYIKLKIFLQVIEKMVAGLLARPEFFLSGNGDHMLHEFPANIDHQNQNNNYQGILLSESSSTIWSVVYEEEEEEEDNDGVGDYSKVLYLTKLEFPLDVEPSLGATCRLSNSCNGLVCVVVFGDSVVIWNPSLQDYKSIPTSPLSDDNGGDIFGIGYDSITDDYKVVRFPSILCDSEHSPRNRIEVFSLKANSWKTIQDSNREFPYFVLQDSRAITMNGRPHWNGHGGILYFDASQECLGQLPWPETSLSMTAIESLQEFRGRLGVHISELCSHHELWVMKEYGVKESWTRLLRIPTMPLPGSPNAFLPLEPFGFTKDGQVLLKKDHYGFFLYNPGNGVYKKFNIPQEITCYFGDIPFVESLVSPNRGDIFYLK